jgi:[acyl-carrier-protein] S-malonyltransferase
MAAIIGLSKELLEDICTAVSSIGICDCANFNAPGQIVISGEKNGVAKACEQAKAAGAKRVLELPVSVAAHSRLMIPAAELFMEHLSSVEIRSPEIPVVHNVDVKPHQDPAEIRSALKQQLYSPVKWDGTIEYLANLGYTDCYECGPGKVLTGLVKRSEASINCLPLSDRDIIESETKRDIGKS